MILSRLEKSDRMEEEKQTSVSIWHRDLNLVFVYVVVFLFGLVVIYIMTSVLNNKVEELSQEPYSVYQQNIQN